MSSPKDEKKNNTKSEEESSLINMDDFAYFKDDDSNKDSNLGKKIKREDGNDSDKDNDKKDDNKSDKSDSEGKSDEKSDRKSEGKSDEKSEEKVKKENDKLDDSNSNSFHEDELIKEDENNKHSEQSPSDISKNKPEESFNNIKGESTNKDSKLEENNKNSTEIDNIQNDISTSLIPNQPQSQVQENVKKEKINPKPKESIFASKNKIDYPKRPKINKSDEKKFLTYKVQSNFFKVIVNSETVYKYSLEFSPFVEGDAVYVRKRILYTAYKDIINKLGNFHYNGSMIFAPNNLQFSPPLEFNAHDKMNNPYKIIIKYAGQCNEKEDSDYMPIIKSFCRKALAGVGQVNIKGAYFSSKESKDFKEQKFQLWQGYKPSVKRNDNTFYINMLPLSKVIRTKSALDELQDLKQSKSTLGVAAFQLMVKERFRNASVLTRYNGDKNYVIIDIDFTKSPNSEFFYKKEKKNIKFIDYYKTRYQNDERAKIKTTNQPLLVALDKKSRRRIRKNIENNKDNNNAQKNVGYSEEDKIYLIPELCYMTGYTEEMRKNFKLMKTISDITKKNICDKMNDLSRMMINITESPTVKKLSEKFPIRFETKPESINVKLIDPGCISMRDNFKHNEIQIPLKEDKLERLAQTMMYSTVTFSQNDGWMIIYYEDFLPKKNRVLETIKKVSDQLGFFLPRPVEIVLAEPKCKIMPDKVPDELYEELKKKVNGIMIHNQNKKFIYSLFIMKGGNKKGFMYKEIKGFFLGELGIVSQCILENTTTKNNLYSIIAKLTHEINAKLNCQPWIVKDVGLKDKRTMFFSYYLAGDKLVGIASADQYYTKYFNSYQHLSTSGEFKKKLGILFFDLLKKFHYKHGFEPQRVLILRDANINAKQMNDEIFELKEKINECIEKGLLDDTKICYVHCSSRHNLKIIGEGGHEIKQGTIVDEVAVQNGKFEFYLISQKCKEGIPMATKYTVIYDDSNIQTIDFYSTILKMCFLYYNRLGGVKLPAPLRNCKEFSTLLNERIKFKGNLRDINDNLKSSTGLYYI